MKNRTKALIFLLVFCALFSLPMNFEVFADTNTSYSWYVKRTKDHSKPPLPNEFEFISQYGGYYVDLRENAKKIYLTFDAGYENGNVERILDVLKASEVKGTFFILSNLINKNPDLVKRMVKEGHVVGNHTSRHHDMSKVKTKENFEKELKTLENEYRELTGREISKFFRPPEGRFSEDMMRFAAECGYKTIFWSLAYADWDNNNQMPKEQAMKKIIENVHDGAIILLHPTSKTNADILYDLIKSLKDQGYSFGTMEELCEIQGRER